MITISFWVLFGLALIMSMEFGQTAIEVIRRGTKDGFKAATLVSLGACLSEILFLILTITGLIFFFSDPKLLKFVWLAGGMIVLYLGMRGIHGNRETVNSNIPAVQDKYRGPFITGLAINLIHPLNIIWWSGTLGPIILESAHKNGFFVSLMDGFGVPLGGLAWWLILAASSSLMRKTFPKSWTEKINLFSSLGLVLLGVYFLYKAFQSFS